MSFLKSTLFAFAIVSIAASNTYAGPYTDDLSKCLVESTSTRDRAALVKWIFSAASLHPAVRSIVSVSEEQLDEANKTAADLIMKLLTESCRQETQKALKYENEVALQASFRVLGQVAGQELFSSPEVAATMSGLDKYLDEEKLKSLIKAD